MKNLVMGLALLAAACLLGPTGAAEEKKDVKPVEKKEIDSKVEKAPCAAAVDFSDLGLAFNSLETIGSRIDAARRNGDPVSLASAAAELGVAESISGKKAKLTASTVAKEARDLATVRLRSKEMKAVGLILGKGLAGDMLAQAAKQAKEEEAGEKLKGLDGTLHVHNHSHQSFRIFVNGGFVGHVHGHGKASFHVHQHHGTTHLSARSNHHMVHASVGGHARHYEWNIR
jgi:hypothetical protein